MDFVKIVANLHLLISSWSKVLDTGQRILVVTLDTEGAFDRVCHEALLLAHPRHFLCGHEVYLTKNHGRCAARYRPGTSPQECLYQRPPSCHPARESFGRHHCRTKQQLSLRRMVPWKTLWPRTGWIHAFCVPTFSFVLSCFLLPYQSSFCVSFR